MCTDTFATEVALRREVADLQRMVADLMDIQMRAEQYRDKVLDEYAELERENHALKREVEDLRWK